MSIIRRSRIYYRVVAPDWVDPANTEFSKQRGGRWNPAGEFGALYLNATIAVAAANARSQHAGRAIKLFDLLPEARPELVTFEIPDVQVVDVVSAKAVAAFGFEKNFPYGVGWPPCQEIARRGYAAGLDGVAARSHAEVNSAQSVGEELVVFGSVVVPAPKARRSFRKWYPDPIPG